MTASRILDKLYQGSEPAVGPEAARLGYQVLVLCAMEFQPEARWFPGVEVIHCPLDDDPILGLSADEWLRAKECSKRVALAIQSGRRALVTCHAGINRSGLVSALTVIRLTGVSGRKAVEIVRAGRPGALRNDSFVRMLETIGGNSRRAPPSFFNRAGYR